MLATFSIFLKFIPMTSQFDKVLVIFRGKNKSENLPVIRFNLYLYSFRMGWFSKESKTTNTKNICINVRFIDEVLRVKSSVQVGYRSGRFLK